MGKWSDKLNRVNASADAPAEPAEGGSAGSAGGLGGAFWVSPLEGESHESIEQMPLSRFAMSGQFLQVHSKVLDEIIVLAADNADLPDLGDTAVYRAAEARLLVGLPPAEVRAYHEVKVFFDGIIERRGLNGTQVDAADLLPESEGVDDDVAE